jgi:hypothetical protein
MKKILELLVYRSNRWYDNLEEPFRFLAFLVGVVVPIGISQILLIVFGLWQPFATISIMFLAWRMAYFARPKKTYVFDIETNGIYDAPHLIGAYKVKHDKTYDQGFIDNLNKSHRDELERIGVAHDSRPEVIDMMEIYKKIEKK